MRSATRICIGVVSASVLLSGAAGLQADETCHWIWASKNRRPDASVELWKEFEIEGDVSSAAAWGLADFCYADVKINGERVAAFEPYGDPLRVDVLELLQRGKNSVRATCRSVDGPAAIAIALEIEYADGRRQTIVSDESFNAANTAAHSFGAVGRYAWGAGGESITISPLDDYEQWKRAIDAKQGTDASQFQVPAGFKIERLHSAAANEGSWVSMTFDPRGRCILAKEGKGLLRVTFDNATGRVRGVESINDQLTECRGMFFAGNDLYAMANGDKSLFRLRDADGDDQFEQVQSLATLEGGGGHGRNQMVLGPDGKLYAICGDSVLEPENASSIPPKLAHPDHFEQTPSGFVARRDLDGKRWEIVVRGLRNPFGIAFNPDGEMFTYDADAEYDMGSSWYRPTRIDHLVPGSDFGWRRVTKQWPPYFPDRPDMPQPTLDIGKGSPTAVVFGTNSKFPADYRRALFALDWAYGRILAVHLTPRGSSYAAYAETFVRGQPANVTDVEFGPDGAMYFVTGGRATQSALYRVAYVGPPRAETEMTAQQLARAKHAAGARRMRKRLEALLGAPQETALDVAWPALASEDPWIRHAARVVVERQPVNLWQQRALAERRPAAALAALVALARMCPESIHGAIVSRVAQFKWNELTTREKLEVVFLYQRCSGETSGLTSEQQHAMLSPLAGSYPDASAEVNRRLALLLSRFEPEEFVPRTFALMEHADVQNDRLHYLFVLRKVQSGWTPKLRSVYFKYLRRMDEYVGGQGMPTFRQLIRDEALAALPDSIRERYADSLKSNPIDQWIAEVAGEKREFVKEWQVKDFDGKLNKLAKGRDLQRGRKLFAAAQCVACHQIGARGGVSGPDLSAVSRRFSPRDLLVSILDPSKVVSEKYQNAALELDDGRVIVGRIMPGDFRSPNLRIVPNLLEPDKTIAVAKVDIADHRQSPVSPMPKGLLNTLTREEVLDLLAFIRSP